MIKISGRICKIYPTVTRSESFRKRIFWLAEQATEYAPNTWELELWNKDCDMIDAYNVGDFVTCYIDIKGKQYTKANGEQAIMNTIKCWNFEKDGISVKNVR